MQVLRTAVVFSFVCILSTVLLVVFKCLHSRLSFTHSY